MQPVRSGEPFREARLHTPIRDLGVRIEGTPLASVLAVFEGEMAAVGVAQLHPRFYLSSEWGVPDGTLAIAIPFYLASAELTELHAERTGHVEGAGRGDILRYLRHELGHVVNYAYLLHERRGWVERFGAITQPYEDEFRPEPFSRRFVRHLPGWYAQKHPDEDWAETFAVWMAHAVGKGSDWREEYAGWPHALAKLSYCHGVMAEIGDRPPLVAAYELHEDVNEMRYSLEELYRRSPSLPQLPPGIDGCLRSIFEVDDEDAHSGVRKPASQLLRGLERDLYRSVYRWTGHFPERTRALVRQMAARADELGLGLAHGREPAARVAVTALVTALAMNHVRGGSYMP
jgi:hypothetical protein